MLAEAEGFLAVQWLGVYAVTTKDQGWTPASGNGIPQATQGQKKKKKGKSITGES